ncbi:MAG: aldolase/citrate lyase family protein [Clostridia bacterium]
MNQKMNKAQQMRSKFARGELVVGGHVFYTDCEITEALGCHGFEFVWIDAEHSAFDKACVLHHIIAAASGNTASIVRVAWNDPVRIKPILEMGPDGIILPMVSSAEEARRAVSACSYPPLGVRGFGPRRANQYGALETRDYLKDVNDSFLRIVQIEHQSAVEHLEEILAVEGIDLAMVGPNDLSASIGHLGDTRHPDVIALYDRIEETCKRLHKPFGVSLGAGDEASIRDWIGRGVNMLGCGDDIAYLSLGCKRTFDLIGRIASGR